MEFSRQEYWSGLQFPPPGDLPDPGIEPCVSCVSCIADEFFTAEPSWKPIYNCLYRIVRRSRLKSGLDSACQCGLHLEGWSENQFLSPQSFKSERSFLRRLSISLAKCIFSNGIFAYCWILGNMHTMRKLMNGVLNPLVVRFSISPFLLALQIEQNFWVLNLPEAYQGI